MKILIIEDEASVAMTMRFLLGLAGCEAEIASTKTMAIQMAETGDFVLITMDVNMPDANGFRLCSELKQNPRLREIPVVFVSGQCSLEDQQCGLEVGAADYITKPFDNTNPNEARGAQAALFKKLFWSGSQAKFYGVTWDGYSSQHNLFGIHTVTPNYHTNVVNALITAPQLATFINGLSGTNTMAAHSLGNMVALSALSDWSANVQNYFMIDAAVAIEAVDGSVGVNTNMVPPVWYCPMKWSDNKEPLKYGERKRAFKAVEDYLEGRKIRWKFSNFGKENWAKPRIRR